MTEKAPPTEPWRDPIVAEVRRAREALFAEAGYDVHELCRRLAKKQGASDHRLLSRPPAPEVSRQRA